MSSRSGFAHMACAIVLLAPLAGACQNSGPLLRVRVAGANDGADNETSFRMGERIPLELSFTAPANQRFELNMATYDRSGRMQFESFDVSAGHWADPLVAYFSGGFIGGGMFGTKALSPEPTVIRIDLNEWVRFDQPGDYSVVVSSKRVTDTVHREPPEYGADTALELKSSPIRLHIVAASRAWRRARLAEIAANLQATQMTQNRPNPERERAIADLRFLGTMDAARIMAQNLRDDEPQMMFECSLGLAGLPEKMHPGAVALLRKQVQDAKFPVSSTLLRTMAVLELTDLDPSTNAQQRQELDRANWTLAMEASPGKEDKARAATVETLLADLPADITPQTKADLGRVLRSSFADLPPDKQSAQIEFNWSILRSDDFLPTLQKLATLELKDPTSNLSVEYETRALKTIALKRWYELDPAGAREEALRQIGSDQPSLTADALYFLPPEPLPQFEDLWARRYVETNDDLFVTLMTRFGTGSSVGLIEQKVDADLDGSLCPAPVAALAYLVKFDPEAAAGPLERVVKPQAAGKSSCRGGFFQFIAHLANGPVLTRAAIEVLNDPDPDAVMDAGIYLAQFGDESAEAPLWDRYLAWSEQWQGRAKELEARDAGSNGNWQQRGLGENLARALMGNQGWLATPQSIAKVLERCVGALTCTQLKQFAEQAIVVPVAVSIYSFRGEQSFHVGQYEDKSLDLLEAKVAQFPRATRFTLAPSSPDVDADLEVRVKAIFEKNGMILQ